MVHALREIRRVLTPASALIDLRPLTGAWPVEVLSARGNQEAGSITPLTQDLEDDEAATNAMAQGERDGLFRREREELFPFQYSWDSPQEMQEYVDKEWGNFAEIDEAVWAQLRSLWAVADGDARVGVRMKLLITRWAKGT